MSLEGLVLLEQLLNYLLLVLYFSQFLLLLLLLLLVILEIFLVLVFFIIIFQQLFLGILLKASVDELLCACFARILSIVQVLQLILLMREGYAIVY
jgi:hypothetical protein